MAGNLLSNWLKSLFKFMGRNVKDISLVTGT